MVAKPPERAESDAGKIAKPRRGFSHNVYYASLHLLG